MNDRELMQQALEALNHVNVQDRVQIITALRERLAQPEMQPCAGRNCGSTNLNLHSAECFEDYDKATGADSNRTWTQAHWTEYEYSIAAAEREACAMECFKVAHGWMRLGAWGENQQAHECAEAIRARGKK